MSSIHQAVAQAKNSQVARLLARQGETFAMESAHPQIFNGLLSAARTGFPASLISAGLSTLDDAVKKGNILSSRSAELHRMLKAASDRMKVPALLRAH